MIAVFVYILLCLVPLGLWLAYYLNFYINDLRRERHWLRSWMTVVQFKVDEAQRALGIEDDTPWPVYESKIEAEQETRKK